MENNIKLTRELSELDKAVFCKLLEAVTALNASLLANQGMIARYAYGQSLGYPGIIKHPGTFRVLHIADGLAFIQLTDSYSTSCYLVGLDGLERVGGGKK